MSKVTFILLSIVLNIFMINSTTNKSNTAILVTSIDYSMTDRWTKTTSNTTPKIITTNSVVIGQKLQFKIIFLKHNPNLVYNLHITTPSGSEYFSKKNIQATPLCIKKNKNYITSDNDYITFNKNDELGFYEIKATIIDLKSRKEKILTQTVELIENKRKNKIDNENFIFNWMTKNYDNPEPENMIDALFYYINSPMSHNDRYYAPFLGFTASLLEDNPYLFAELFRKYNESELRPRLIILDILQYLEDFDEVKIFLKSIPQDDLEYYINNKSNYFTLDENKISDSAQLDALWGAFFESGKYKYILAIIKTFELKEKSIVSAAKWSILNNYINIKLVKDYCDYIYANEKISESTKKYLSRLVNMKK